MRSIVVVVLALVLMTLSSTFACPINVTPETLTGGTQGSAYSETLAGNGGTGPYNFTLESGSLPNGVSLNIDGTLSGTPTAIGQFNFTVFVVDADSCNVSQQFLLTVTGACASITVNPPVLASGLVGQPYSVIMTAAGGASPYNFSVSAGSLPTGITLSSTGTLSGTPTESGVFSLSISATDDNLCVGSRDYNLTLSCATITVSPASLTPSLGNPTSITLSATGGLAPYTFEITDGALPDGLTLTDGVISGTPTATGPFSVTITASDNNTCTGSRSYSSSVESLSITAPDTIEEATLDTGITSVTFVANGTVGGPFTWSSPNLPAGLTLSPSGVLSGSPHIYGSVTITIVVNANGYIGSRNYTFTVNACPEGVTVTPAQLEGAIAGETYTDSITTSSGQGYYDFALASGSLPSGLSLATTGAVTGTATETGDFTFNVTATRRDSPCGSISGVVALHVCQGWDVLLRSNVSDLTEGDHIDAEISLIDGSGNDVSVDWESAIEQGELPPGVTLSEDGDLTGTTTEAGTYQFTVVIKVNTGVDAGCEYTASFTITVNEKSSAAQLSSWLSMW